MDDLDSLGDKEFIQSALRGDFDLVARYGEQHPATWVGAWWDNEPAVRIVAAFTGDAAQHDAALRPRLPHPDRLVVQIRPHSLAKLRRIRQEIERTHGQSGRRILTSVGEGAGVIRVILRADQEDVAGELADRYGSAVDLRVGAFSFPDRGRRHAQAPAEPGLPEQTFAGLELSLEVDQEVLAGGDTGHGRLVLRNGSPERIGPLYSGRPMVGFLLNASLETVGGYSGFIAGTGLHIDLAPGQSVSVPVIFGTASTRADLGYVVAPGEYWLKVQLRYQLGLDAPENVITAPLTRITIIPRARSG